MTTLMIVEDEPVERRAVRQLIAEHFDQVEILPDCSNGAEALSSALRYAPDILVLDIKIPGMNGIEVVKQLRRSGYSGKIMMCTAYDLFDYAKDALNYGANAFLLKPVKHADFVGMIGRFIAERAPRAKDGPPGSGFTEDMIPYLIPGFLSNSRGASPAPEEFKLRNWLRENISRAILISLDLAKDQKASLACSGHLLDVIYPQMERRVFGALPEGFRLLRTNDDRGFLLFGYSKAPCADELMDLRARFAACLLGQRLEGHECFRIEIGISNVITAPEEYAGAYADAMAGRTRRSVPALLGEAAAVRRIAVSERAIECFWEDGNLKSDPEEAADHLLRLHLSGDAAPVGERLAAATAILLKMREKAGNGLFEKLPEAFSDPAIAKWYRALAKSAFGAHRRAMSGNPEYALKLACKYIHRNFSQDLSLARVAGHVGLSAPYLSHLFSQKLSMGFVDYLQTVRMNELRLLLASGEDFSIRELSARLGYNSENYFCRVVKQKTGKTIKQLKKQLCLESRP